MHTDREEQAVSVPTGENLPPPRARTRHIVQFVVACVLLAGAVGFLLMPALLFQPVELPDEPSDFAESTIPGAAILAVMVMGLGMAIAQMIALGGFALCWVVGAVIAVLLAMNKTNKPRWLWVASLALAFAYLAVLAVMSWIWLWV